MLLLTDEQDGWRLGSGKMQCLIAPQQKIKGRKISLLVSLQKGAGEISKITRCCLVIIIAHKNKFGDFNIESIGIFCSGDGISLNDDGEGLCGLMAK